MLDYLHILLLGDTSCPSGCDCIGFEQCKWSGQTVRIIAGLPPQTPAWFWYAFLFQNDICDRGNRKVCCCGVKQIGTAEFKMQPKDCEWGPYKPQGECSKSCDGGVQTMKRLKTKKARHGKYLNILYRVKKIILLDEYSRALNTIHTYLQP